MGLTATSADSAEADGARHEAEGLRAAGIREADPASES